MSVIEQARAWFHRASEHATAASARAVQYSRTKWPRRIGIGILTVLVLFGLFGFFGVPPILRHVLTTQVAASLKRPVSVGHIGFNPYTLRLDVDQLHIGDRTAPKPFVDIGHLRVKASWTSLFRLAPVVHQVSIDKPSIHLVRTADQSFNFSDLIAPGPAPATPAPPGKPFRFAVSNIQLRDGQVLFDDQMLGEQHSIEHLQVGVPFIANLPSYADIFVQPLLQMMVDGSPVLLSGKSKPFTSTRESIVDLDLHQLDLARYLAYVPRKLAIRVPQGTMSCALQVHFVSAAAGLIIAINGPVSLDKIDVRDAANAPLIALNHAVAELNDVEPLENVAHLERIFIDGLDTHLVLNADGTTNLTALMGPPAAAPVTQTTAAAEAPTTPPGSAVAQSAAAPAAAAPNATPTPLPTIPLTTAAPEPAPTDFSLATFQLSNSAVNLTDNSGPAPAMVALNGIHIGLKDLRTLGQTAPAPFDMGASFGGGGTLTVKGGLDLKASQVTTDVALDQIDLPALQAFAQTVVAATIPSGKLTANATVKTDFKSGQFNVHAEPASVALDNFELRAAGQSEAPIGWTKFSVSIGQVDLASHQAVVKEVRSDGLHVYVHRAHDGQLSLTSLMRPATAPPSPAAGGAEAAAQEKPRARLSARERREEEAERRRREELAARQRREEAERKRREEIAARRQHAAPAPAVAAAPAAPAWKYQIESVALDKTSAHVVDDSGPQPLDLTVAPLNLQAKDVSSDFAKPFTMALDGTLNHKGSFDVKGNAAITPLKADLHVITKALDLAPANPFVASRLNTTITSAALSMNGAVAVENARNVFHASYRGDATLGNVRMLDKVTGDPFVRWNAFSFSRIDADFGGAKPKVHVGGIALSNFYARIILNADGKLNLNDITSNPQAAPESLTRAHGEAGGAPLTAPSPAATPSAAAVPSPAAAPSPAVPTTTTGTTTAGGEVTTATVAPAPQPINADIAIGRVTLEGGKINYTDDFIKPNYTANFTDVAGKVGAFGTSSSDPADVSLQGQINGSSPVNLNGSVNPLVPMAYVDLKAKADGVELTGLSAYSTKYTGYPIVKGTLTVNVAYLLDHSKLTADNHIFIDQLTFGDHVDSPTASNLPIRLAVALLKNSQGQIDLDIPVSGSLSDPQFSLGGVIWHAVLNIIVKAATSPFSLVAAAVGGIAGGSAEELGYVEFAPGYSTLTPDSQKKLTTVASVLKQKSGLRLDIVGRIDPSVDKDGMRDAKVDHQVAVQKVRDDGKGDASTITLTPDEYNKYLKQVYKAAKFPKPRDLVGLDKSIPPDQMKKLLVTNTTVNDQDLAQLANDRANSVRAFLSKDVEAGRLFVMAPKLNANGIQGKGKTTRVDLSLE